MAKKKQKPETAPKKIVTVSKEDLKYIRGGSCGTKLIQPSPGVTISRTTIS
jgi:hypothetical protein